MGMILRIASSRIVGQGDIVGRSGYFSLNLSANSVMRGRLDARRTLKSLVADLRSSYFLEDGSFIKLENVTLGYNFTPKNRKLLDNMRIYLSAKNLFTLTGYSGNDPSIIDVNGIQPGVDSNSAYPTATQLSLGVTLRFK